MHAVGRPSRHSPPAVVALATSPGVGAGPRRGRLGVRARLAERGVRLVSEGGRQGTRSPPEGEDSATFRKKRRRIPSSSKRQVWFLSLAAFANPPSHHISSQQETARNQYEANVLAKYTTNEAAHPHAYATGKGGAGNVVTPAPRSVEPDIAALSLEGKEERDAHAKVHANETGHWVPSGRG